MKHIKRKFSGHIKVDGLLNTLSQATKGLPTTDEIPKSIPEGMKAILFTDKNEMFYAFSFRDAFQGKECLVPEPEPTLVYFNLVQINYRLMVTEKGRSNLVDLLADLIKSDTTKVMHKLYDFLGQSSTFAISLFMAMESAINKVIPDDFELREKGSKNTIVYDNLQVQQLEFSKKVKEVLPEITGKKFWEDHPTEWNFLIVDLKRFRDEIVHTKKSLGSQTHYKDINVMALNFDYKRALLYGKTLINYYHSNLVEECPCGADF